MYNAAKIDPKMKTVPEKPGVYLMKDNGGNIIYVGKAVILKRRLGQYFNNSQKPVKVQAMVDKVDDFEYYITLTESDALVLESTLIKKHMPRYNILLKDDKGRPVYVRLNVQDEYPSIEVTRTYNAKDGAKYFGPYVNAFYAKSIVRIIKMVYGIRTCSRKMSQKRECLDWHIGMCKAPCMNRISKEEYGEACKAAMNFIGGKDNTAETVLEEKIQKAVELENYETAIEYRDMLTIAKKINAHSLVDLNLEDSDFFAYITDGRCSAVAVLPIRNSKLYPDGVYLSEDAAESTEALTSFIIQYYEENPIPNRVYVNLGGERELLEMRLNEMAGTMGADKRGMDFLRRRKMIKVLLPHRTQIKSLMQTAEENARESIEKYAESEAKKMEQTYGACEMLCERLGLKSARRIECYDISHISGTDKVASGVCFINGAKAGDEYRRYKIKTVEGNDDFHCMAEVLKRRLLRAADGDKKFADLPDLIVIDGGKGQLHAAYDIMKEAGFDIPMVGLAKRMEEIFVTGKSEPILLSRDNAALKLLQRIRDEAHRFAITYHRKTRMKRISTELTSIKGVGEKTSKMLLKRYGSLANIKALPLEVLEATEGLNKPMAVAIYEHLHGEIPPITNK